MHTYPFAFTTASTAPRSAWLPAGAPQGQGVHRQCNDCDQQGGGAGGREAPKEQGGGEWRLRWWRPSERRRGRRLAGGSGRADGRVQGRRREKEKEEKGQREVIWPIAAQLGKWATLDKDGTEERSRLADAGCRVKWARLHSAAGPTAHSAAELARSARWELRLCGLKAAARARARAPSGNKQTLRNFPVLGVPKRWPISDFGDYFRLIGR